MQKRLNQGRKNLVLEYYLYYLSTDFSKRMGTFEWNLWQPIWTTQRSVCGADVAFCQNTRTLSGMLTTLWLWCVEEAQVKQTPNTFYVVKLRTLSFASAPYRSVLLQLYISNARQR